MGEHVLPPPIVWAQRSAVVFLTINLEDCQDPDIKIYPNSVYFKGVGGVDKKLYEVTIHLYKEIDTENSKYFNRGRIIEFILSKKNLMEPYWPHLTADRGKHHWLKCDFNKWQDEEQSDTEHENPGDFEDMMRRMGGIGGGTGAAGDSKNFFDDERAASDSDDDQIPGLE